jgi:hypothetical protein
VGIDCTICHGLGWVPEWGPVHHDDLGLLLQLEDYYDLVGEPIQKRPCTCTHEDNDQ